MKTIKPGSVHTEMFYPESAHLASDMGNHGVDVVATTAIILYFETVANNLISPYYDDGEVSVGTHVHIDHLAPATGDRPIQVTAVLKKQGGRRIEFELEAKQGNLLIMRGKHFRAVTERQRFSSIERLPQNNILDSKRQIEFWFDFHSPWCYFACHRIGDVARKFSTNLIWKPVHLANLSQAVDGRRPTEANTRFVSWYEQDQRDTALMQGLSFDPHTDYPKRPSRALRAAIYAADNDLAEPFVKTIMQGYWSQQKDISDIAWLCDVAEEVGLSRTKLEESTSDPYYKGKLEEHLQIAVEQNVFGLPASIVDGKIFWGNDRLGLLSHHLSGRSPSLRG